MDPLVDRDALVSDLAEAFAAEQTLVERLESAVGGLIKVSLSSTVHAEGTLLRVSRDHLWMGDETGFWVIVIGQVEAVTVCTPLNLALGLRSRAEENRQPGLGSALREARGSGRSVNVLIGARWVAGKPTCVGRDFLEIDSVVMPFARIVACRVWY